MSVPEMSNPRKKKVIAVALVAAVLIFSYFAFFTTPRLSGTYFSDGRTITLKPSVTITFLDSGGVQFKDNTLVTKLVDATFATGQKEFVASYSIEGNRITFSRTWGSDTETKEMQIEMNGSILHDQAGEIYRKQGTK